MLAKFINNSNKTLEYINNLPLELQKIIFYFIPLTSIRTNQAKLIGNIMDVYSIDHDPDLTKIYRVYYIKNIMSFSRYVFDTLYREQYCGCIYGREEYDMIDREQYCQEEYDAIDYLRDNVKCQITYFK